MERVALAVLALIGVPLATCGYIILAERLIRILPGRRHQAIRPWLWLAPALVLLTVFLIYPSLHTIVLSLYDAGSTNFVGFQNYFGIFTDGGTLIALRNNVIWLVVFTSITVSLGLVVAVLTDRVPYENVA